MNNDYFGSVIKQFSYYQMLGENAMDQIPEEQLFWQYNQESNSIATIVKHLWGNMLSRWTNFLTSDGEKKWRNRDLEFENDVVSKTELLTKWNEGWKCLFDALHSLTDADLNKEIFIRNMSHTVIEAINRQLAHYAYHIGQIVYISKMVSNENWNSLSIPKGNSIPYNEEKFPKPNNAQQNDEE